MMNKTHSPTKNTDDYQTTLPQKKVNTYPPAPLLQRFIALLIDSTILTILSQIYLGIGILFVWAMLGRIDLFQPGAEIDPEQMAQLGFVTLASLFLFLLIFLVGFFILFHGYYIYFEVKKGATPGKQLFGLKVISIDGIPPNASKLTVRETFRYIDAFVFPAVICMTTSDKRQRLGDVLARVYVAKIN